MIKVPSCSSICLFMNEGWPLSGHEIVTEARLLLRLLVRAPRDHHGKLSLA